MKKREKKVLAFLMAAAMTVSGLSGFGAREAKADESDFVSVGQNVLLGKTAIASSVANNAGPELAVDGVKDQPQQWNSADMKGSAIRDDGSQTPQWILIDRGEDAQPVRIRRAAGAARRRRNTALRASRSPRAVMAQLLTQTTSAWAGSSHSTPPRACQASRRDCVSYWFTLQPKVMK